jgi:hypothetical protein
MAPQVPSLHYPKIARISKGKNQQIIKFFLDLPAFGLVGNAAITSSESAVCFAHTGNILQTPWARPPPVKRNRRRDYRTFPRRVPAAG